MQIMFSIFFRLMLTNYFLQIIRNDNLLPDNIIIIIIIMIMMMMMMMMTMVRIKPIRPFIFDALWTLSKGLEKICANWRPEDELRAARPEQC